MNIQSMNNIHVLNLSKYTNPLIVEEKNKDYVSYGADNNYFQYLIDRYTGSATNNAIISGIVNMIYGKGIDALDSKRKPQQYAMMKGLLKPNDLRRIINDRKMLGMASIQITYEKSKVKAVSHFPMETLRATKCNDQGEIEEWAYHPNWKEYKKSDKLEFIKSFGYGNKKGNEIYVIKPYVSGYYYYTPVDYVGALPYAVLEEEIADYLINDTINGFSGTKVINFNNGVPDEEKQLEIKSDVLKKLTGARGERVIVAFNDNAENKTTVEDLPLNDAPAHYQYLSDECRNKLLISHKVTSPLLLGIREAGGGLGSNADEIKNSSIFFDNIVIKSYQNELIEVLTEILAINDINLKLYFKTIQPLEFTDTEGMDSATKEEETGVKMSKDNEGFNDDEMLNALNGETVSDEWELVDEREHCEDNESVEYWAKRLIKPKKSLLTKLANFIKSKPSEPSTLDKSYYKVRYKYSEKYSSGKSRNFCRTMMSRTDNGVVYRKEDIDQASFQGVNNSFGHKGQNYSLFKYKGGVNCGHYWSEQLYRLKQNTDGTFKEDKALSSSAEVDSIPESYIPKGVDYITSEIAPKDMPNNGHHPNYGKK
jgi:hypothetical protein